MAYASASNSGLFRHYTFLGDEHPETTWTMRSLASTYHSLGKLQEAEELEAMLADGTV